MEHFPRKKIKLPYESIMRATYGLPTKDGTTQIYIRFYAQLKRHQRKVFVGDNPTLIPTVFVCSHDQATVVIMFYCFRFNKVPSKTFGMPYGDS